MFSPLKKILTNTATLLTGHTSINSVIGTLADLVTVPYTEGINTIMAFLHTGYYHVHGTSFVYPDHADEVLLTAGAGAWDLTGAKTEIIPADTLGVADFDLHWMEVSSISEVATIQIDIFKGLAGSEIKIGSAKATRSTSQTRNGPARIQIPQQEANKRISCQISSSVAGATTCLVSFSGHYYAL